MLHVKIERCEIATEMQLRIVIERATTIKSQAIIDGPGQDVAERVKIKVEIERDRIVQAEIFVINRTIVYHANAERDDAAIESPDKKAHPFRHDLAELGKIFLGQLFEFHGRTLMHRQVKGINLVKMRGDVANDFELDLGCALGFAKLPPQTLARAVAQMREVIVKVTEAERQPCHRHAWNAGETVLGKS